MEISPAGSKLEKESGAGVTGGVGTVVVAMVLLLESQDILVYQCCDGLNRFAMFSGLAALLNLSKEKLPTVELPLQI